MNICQRGWKLKVITCVNALVLIVGVLLGKFLDIPSPKPGEDLVLTSLRHISLAKVILPHICRLRQATQSSVIRESLCSY